MGNKLCCDTRIDKELAPQLQQSAKDLIQKFMDANPSIRQVCSNPGQIERPVDLKNVTYYEKGTYVGKISNNKRNDLGLMMFKDGMYYEGEWVNDLFEGQGKFIFTNGNFYSGLWKEGLPQGQGLYVSRNPIWRYDGLWEKGVQNGHGQQIFQDGSVYDGNFLNGLRHGKGTFRNHDGRSYTGNFSQGEVQGFAQACNFNYLYQGEWKKGKPHGTGKSEWQEDKKTTAQYIGQYRDGKKQGFGQYQQKNGVTYKGTWKDGYITNVGIIIQDNKKLQSAGRL